MAKIRVHELAKELKRDNKEILLFLKEKGIEKTASSGLDPQDEQMVREAFGEGKSAKSADTDKNAAKENTASKVNAKATGAKSDSASKKAAKAEASAKEDTKQEAAQQEAEKKQEIKQENAKKESATKDNSAVDTVAKTDKTANENSKAAGASDAAKASNNAEAPKKKKTIIIVNNAMNSRNQPARNNGGNQMKNGNNNNFQRPNGNGGNQKQNPVHTPIKPLTPPSPTPSVQMVPGNVQQQKRVNPAPEKQEQKANNVSAAPVETVKTVQENTTAAKTAVEEAAKSNSLDNTKQNAKPVVNNNAQNQQSRDNGNSNRQGGQYQGNRDGNRDNGSNNNRQSGQFSGGRDNGFNNRQNGQSQSGRDGGRDNGYNNRQGGQYQSDRNAGRDNGYNNRQGNFGGQGGGQYGGNKDGRTGQYQGGGRDGRDNGHGFGGQGGRSGQFAGRDGKQGKGAFAGEAPGKDMEKKREEDKRRVSQEKDRQRNKKDYMYEEDEAIKNKPGRFIKPEKKKEEVVEETIKVITLPESITIKDLADKMKQQPAALIKKLFMQGKIVTLNQEISYEEAEMLAMDYEILCEKEVKVDVIEELLKEEEENTDELVERPPVICVMGHVDHGKTSLLDAIRKTNVTDKEAGGITQHIGAYTVTLDGRNITFLDTPGHEAFTAMRMRGANSTDIAILVVAADDGVMPQTIEAINHAKAAGIEIIVAVNKIDKPSANIERVKQELTEYQLIATDWGGNTEFVPVSAKSGEGISDLLETILLTADILELKANPNRKARGLVIEAELDKGRGPVATVLVQKGTLHVGDFISAGASHGKVRAMVDDKGRRVKEAGPSTPVEILGLNDVPSAGEVFLAHENDKTAKNFAETYMAQNKEKMLEDTKSKMTLDDLFSQIKEGNLKELNLIVKADVQGSVEAVKQSLLKLSNEEVVVKCIHGGVGAINESDVVLASASNAIIIGFNVRPDATAKTTAEREGVDVRLYKVIYQAIEDIEAAMKGMLDPIFEEKVIGHAEVRQIFRASAIGNIAGSYVLDGTFQRNCKVRITREGEQIYEGELASLKRFKDDVKEVKAGFECGLVFDGFDQMQELDIVEAYIMVEVPR